MDIDLLSKIVKEIVLDNDSVTLPGIGSFLAEIVPSSFSDKGYTINPPYRRLYFTRKEGTDTLLVDFYASSNKVSRDDATRIVVTFLSEMKEVLKEKKTVQFPGLGRLRATKENNFFFIPDEDLDIYPAGFGLAPISLKTHEETEDEVSAAVAGIASVLDEPIEPATPEKSENPETPATPEKPENPETPATPATPKKPENPETPTTPATPEKPELPEKPTEPATRETPSAPEKPETPEEPATEAPEPNEPSEPKESLVKKSAAVGAPVMTSQEALEDMDKKELRDARKGWRRHRRVRISKVILIIFGILLLLLVIYAIIARINPALVDRFLYNEEELEIIKMMKL